MGVRRMKIKYCYLLFLILILISLLNYFGAFTHYYEIDFSRFNYPVNGDIRPYMNDLKLGKPPRINPLNTHNYYITKNANEKCHVTNEDGDLSELRLVYLVKSASNNFERRKIIRSTWGYERRFSDVPIKTIFLLGKSVDAEVNNLVKGENDEFRDIVQGDFVDSYYNNTYKALLGLKWANTLCPNSRFYFFVDDDYYVSTRNVLRYLRNPTYYPRYLQEDIDFDQDVEIPKYKNRNLKQLINYELPKDVKFYSGFVFSNSSPHRHGSSKWYISLDEYPYDLWPPYVTAGAYILSKGALSDFYWASYFVQRFRFDDIYVGLLAKKTQIEPYHSTEFYFDKKVYRTPRDYEYVVASHGFSDSEELMRFWSNQKQAGNA